MPAFGTGLWSGFWKAYWPTFCTLVWSGGVCSVLSSAHSQGVSFSHHTFFANLPFVTHWNMFSERSLARFLRNLLLCPSVKLVLNYLMGSLFEPMYCCLQRLLTIKMVFSVAIKSARWIGELQALSVHPSYTSFFPDKQVIWTYTSFLAKVVTPFHGGQSITLSTTFALPHPLQRRRDSIV